MRRDPCIALAVAALGCLVVMVGITVATGASQEAFEIVRAPEAYAGDLRGHAGPLRLLFAVDTAFVVVYAAFFILFGQRIGRAETRLVVAVALGCVLAAALLDMVEDHHILALLSGAELGQTPEPGTLRLQHTISQVKFNVSYLGLFLYGLAIPRRTMAGVALAVLLTVGTVVQGVWIYAAPAALLPGANLGRTVGYLIGFVLAIPVLRQLAQADRS